MSAHFSGQESPAASVHLLWTGGWDSTFRLIQLLSDTQAKILPIYVIDTDRRSTLMEIKTMGLLRGRLEASFPSSSYRLLPHLYFSRQDIPVDQNITQKYTNLREKAVLGIQYEWLARLAKAKKISPLELSVHVDDKAHRFLKDYTVRKHEDEIGDYYALDSGRLRPDQSDLALFSYFRFPILEWSKKQMRQFAADRGVLDIMLSTWFCFTPIRNRPCGVCNPCRYSLAEGMNERFSRAARIRNGAISLVPALRRIWMRLL